MSTLKLFMGDNPNSKYRTAIILHVTHRLHVIYNPTEYYQNVREMKQGFAFNSHSREMNDNKKSEKTTILAQDQLSMTELNFYQTLLQYLNGYIPLK